MLQFSSYNAFLTSLAGYNNDLGFVDKRYPIFATFLQQHPTMT